MQLQGNPNQGQEANNPNRSTQPATEQNERLSTNNPATQPGQKPESDAYRREGVHLGGSSSGSEQSQTSGSTQKGGGGSGYDVSKEQQEVNKEREHMHNERDNDELNPERTQSPRPETDPGREHPDQQPSQPETKPGTSTMGSTGRDITGSWSQSSWDPNSPNSIV